MNRDDAEQVDRRLVMALLRRMRTADKPDALSKDLERMNILVARAQSRPNDADEVLAEGHRLLAKQLPENDPEREILEKKAEALERAQEARSKGQKRQVHLPRPYDESRLKAEHREKIRVDPELSWPLPPPFPGDWQDLDQETLVRQVVRAEAAYGSNINFNIFLQLVGGRRTTVPCYPGFELVEFLWVRADGEAEGLLFLLGEEIALWLTGVSPGIHELNAGAAGTQDESVSRVSFLDLSDAAKAESNLRFFCAMVTGEEGPFHVIGSAAELEQFWLEDAVPTEVSEVIAPLEIERIEPTAPEDGKEAALETVIWRIKTCILYARVLFHATFNIRRDGKVEMAEDDPLVTEELPVRAERYEDGGRVVVSYEKNAKAENEIREPIEKKSAVPAHHVLAGKLMRDAASFFEHIAEQNAELAPQMKENSDVFRQVADLVAFDPLGKIDEVPYPTHTELAAKLLLDAAQFLTTIADQNPEMSGEMRENADVFAEVARRVRDDPTGLP